MIISVINLHLKPHKHLEYKIPSKFLAKNLQKGIRNLLNKFKEIILQ